MTTVIQNTPDKFLGRLNDVEKKYEPAMLYVAGRQELLRRRPRVSVIGSRDATIAGSELACEIARVVVARGGVVVSGLAEGIDTVAHLAAMEAGGDTIAVIGTPLSRAYPKENESLQRELMRTQLVVTQFPEGKPIGRENFILRNRTMALLSHGSVIVEAGAKSGTEHQGWEALRLGRELFLPTSLVEAGFDWPGKMVSYGAVVFQNALELGELLDEFLPSVPTVNVRRETGF